jgi:uncharacterized membrane protein YesL
MWILLRALGTVVLSSLVWIVALGTVVAVPAVTVAVLRVAFGQARGHSRSPVIELIAAVREDWRRATLTAVAVAFPTAILALDIWIAAAMPDPIGPVVRMALVSLAVWWGLINVYVWPLVAVTDMPVGSVLRTAVVLSLVELPRAILALGGVGVALLVALSAPSAVACLAAGLVALIWGRTIWPVLARRRQVGQPEPAPVAG